MIFLHLSHFLRSLFALMIFSDMYNAFFEHAALYHALNFPIDIAHVCNSCLIHLQCLGGTKGELENETNQ